MSMYESDQNVEPARIPTIAGARKQWRRTGTAGRLRTEFDFFREEHPDAGTR
ncbi:hypothetical protein [Curtobacterium flaccumfaciens]|uniref:hypothetical protein n=1 Tax=Curtobacterium flaccumfaciens TaxID=2035 RepID=UPI001E4509F6|nr:hypothetical protein [Curtobacterium allii]MCE0459699.1 hypothetical protein [Curtobacterium allii]